MSYKKAQEYTQKQIMDKESWLTRQLFDEIKKAYEAGWEMGQLQLRVDAYYQAKDPKESEPYWLGTAKKKLNGEE